MEQIHDRADGRQDGAGHRRHRQASARRPPWAWPPWVRASRSPAGTAGAPRPLPGRSAPPAAGRWTCSSPTCPPRRRCGGWPTRCCSAVRGSTCWSTTSAGYWNTRHVTADGLERTFALNHLAPFLLTNLLLDRLTAERPGSGRHGRLQRTGPGPHRLRRPPGRAVLLRLAGLQPVQARQRAVQLRAGQKAARHVRHRQRAASRRGQHSVRRRGPRHRPAGVDPVPAAVHEDPGPGRRHVDPPGFRSRSRAGDRPLLRQQQTQEVLERSYDEAAAARLWQVSADLVGLSAAGTTPLAATTCTENLRRIP